MAGSDMSGWRDRLHNFWVDQGILRTFWSNSSEIAAGVFRSNQPDPKRLAKLKSQGFKSIVYLRGSSDGAAIRVERAACAELGLDLHVCRLSARRLPSVERVLELVDLFRKAEKPMLLHCRAGADRTGLASAVYLLVFEKKSIADAKSMLSPRFGHYKWAVTGVLDHLFVTYEEDYLNTGMSFEEWLRTKYDPIKITENFENQSLINRIIGTFRKI